MPLPNRIPMPDDETLSKMEKLGFKIEPNSAVEISGKSYVEYVMPEKWSLKDNRLRYDLPNYYFVDQDGIAQFHVFGRWKGGYDNDLSITSEKNPSKYKPQEY